MDAYAIVEAISVAISIASFVANFVGPASLVGRVIHAVALNGPAIRAAVITYQAKRKTADPSKGSAA
jgi:hypothetical protein